MNSHNAPSTTGSDTAIESLRKRMPEMVGVAEAFAVLDAAASDIINGEAAWPPFTEVDAAAFSEGKPLLADMLNRDFEALFLESAAVILPAVQRAFPAIASGAGPLLAALEGIPGLAAQCVRAAMTSDEQTLNALSEQLDTDVPTLAFLLQEIVRPCLKRAASSLGRLVDDNLWFKGHCPVCGSQPDMGYLKRLDDPSEFLVSKAGKLWLHCSMCSHEWRFIRLVCPSCGQEDHERLQVITAEGHPEERIHVCQECKHYLLVSDLTGEIVPLHDDLAPLGLVHLDILAQREGYAPMARRPWNTFRSCRVPEEHEHVSQG